MFANIVSQGGALLHCIYNAIMCIVSNLKASESLSHNRDTAELLKVNEREAYLHGKCAPLIL